jgi:hypothetical protein
MKSIKISKKLQDFIEDLQLDNTTIKASYYFGRELHGLDVEVRLNQDFLIIEKCVYVVNEWQGSRGYVRVNHGDGGEFLKLDERLIACWFIEHAIGEEQFDRFKAESLEETINRFERGEWSWKKEGERRRKELMEERRKNNLNPFGGPIEKGGVWEGWWDNYDQKIEVENEL